jgi:predicted ribosome-associated RNA-binding protein Tma20
VKDMVTGEKKDSVVALNNTISRDKNSTNIVTKTEQKVHKIVFDKRVLVFCWKKFYFQSVKIYGYHKVLILI